MQNNPKEKIKKFIGSNLIVFEDDIVIGDDDNIFQMGYVNSLFAMKLLGYVEREFQIKIENDELDLKNFSTVSNIVQLIDKKLEIANDQ